MNSFVAEIFTIGLKPNMVNEMDDSIMTNSMTHDTTQYIQEPHICVLKEQNMLSTMLLYSYIDSHFIRL